jgi:HSP20 family protein
MIYRRFFDYPNWRVRTPFEQLEKMRQQMERLYEDVRSPFQSSHAGVFPLINLTEDADNYYVRAELPGVKANELDIQVTANNLSISGERKIEAEEEGAKYHRRERDAGRFSRSLQLPGEIDSEKVEAKLEDGIVTVVISKADVAKPKQISVSS